MLLGEVKRRVDEYTVTWKGNVDRLNYFESETLHPTRKLTLRVVFRPGRVSTTVSTSRHTTDAAPAA
jgi:hypothetical protein